MHPSVYDCQPPWIRIAQKSPVPAAAIKIGIFLVQCTVDGTVDNRKPTYTKAPGGTIDRRSSPGCSNVRGQDEAQIWRL